MNYLDYRKALGIGFEDESKAELLKSKIITFFEALNKMPYLRQNFDTDMFYVYYLAVGETKDDYYTWYRLALNIVKEESVSSIVCRYVIFVNHLDEIFSSKYYDFSLYKESISKFIYESLNDLKISYYETADDDGLFIFPNGARELDDALVSEPLEWLKEYPETQKEMIVALKMYSDATSENAYKIADAFRAALERFFQNYFCAADRSLENFKDDLGTHLKNNGVPSEIRNIMIKNFELYTKYMNNYAKHTNKAKKNVLEFIMYQTGIIIRTVITVGKEE